MSADGSAPSDDLLRNRGDGSFENTAAAGLRDTSRSSGCAVGYYDNGGDPGLDLTNRGRNRWHRGAAGRFRDVSEAADMRGPAWHPSRWSIGAAFADIDSDGDLYLFLANLAAFDLETSPPPPTRDSACKLKRVPIMCAPKSYDGQRDLLYMNAGDRTLRDASATDGMLQSEPGQCFEAVVADCDSDQELCLSNDSKQNFYYTDGGTAGSRT